MEELNFFNSYPYGLIPEHDNYYASQDGNYLEDLLNILSSLQESNPLNPENFIYYASNKKLKGGGNTAHIIYGNVEVLKQKNFDTLAKNMWDYFIAKGLSKEMAAGFIGNAWVESNFNPKASNGTHWGIFQLDKNLINHFNKRYKNWQDPVNMWQYAVDYAKGNLFKTSVDKQNLGYRSNHFIKASHKTAADSAKAVANYFERCNGQAMKARLAAANYYYNKFSKARFLEGGKLKLVFKSKD